MKNLRIIFTFSFLSVCLLFAGSQDISAQETQIAKNSIEKENISVNGESKSTENTDTKSDDITADAKPKSVYSANVLKRVGVQTDQSVPLSLNDAIRKALENNNSIEVSRTDVRFQETQLRSLLGTYDPVFSFTPTYTRNSTTGSTATNDFVVNSNFSQLIRPGGGNYQVFFNNSRTENRFAQAQLSSGSDISGASTSAIYSSRAGFQYTQPLFRDFRIDNTRRLIKVQKKILQQSDADFRRQTIEVIAQVQRAYWDLVFALRDQQNRTANLNLARENLRRIEAQIDAGAAAPLARAEVATELANREGDVLLAAQQVSITENTLKTLVLRDLTAAEWTSTYLPTDAPVFSLDTISLENAMKDAIDNRPELRRLRLQKDINEIDIAFFKNQTKPRIDLVTNFSLDGLSQSANGASDDIDIPQFTGNDEILRQRVNILSAIHNLTPIDNPITTVPGTPGFLVGGYNRALANIFRSDAPWAMAITLTPFLPRALNIRPLVPGLCFIPSPTTATIERSSSRFTSSISSFFNSY